MWKKMFLGREGILNSTVNPFQGQAMAAFEKQRVSDYFSAAKAGLNAGCFK
jgi:hypothetical protein